MKFVMVILLNTQFRNLFCLLLQLIFHHRIVKNDLRDLKLSYCCYDNSSPSTWGLRGGAPRGKGSGRPRNAGWSEGKSFP